MFSMCLYYKSCSNTPTKNIKQINILQLLDNKKDTSETCSDVPLVSIVLNLLLQMLVKPCLEFTLPQNAVLWFQNEVRFFWEYHQFALYSTHLCHVECLQAFGIWYAEVLATCENQDRCIPVLYEVVWRSFVRLLSYCIVLFPVWSA